jgi:2-dehydropantoate 2-reductase
MRIAVVGAGGIGGMIGGHLARAGADVAFIARGVNLHALRTHGLTVRSPTQQTFHVDVQATDDPREIGPVDVVWVCVKTYDLDTVACQIEPLIGKDTLVLTVQNGVEAGPRLAEVFGAPRVLGCIALGGGTLVEPGVVEEKLSRTVFTVGTFEGDPDARLDRLRDACSEAIQLEISQDIECALWEKMVVGCVSLGLTAVSRLPLGPLFACTSSTILARRLMDEVCTVARARGVNLGHDVAEQQHAWLAGVATANPSARGSMYFDLVAGKPLELDAVTGAVVRLGGEMGVPTPYNFGIYATLAPVAGGRVSAES